MPNRVAEGAEVVNVPTALRRISRALRNEIAGIVCVQLRLLLYSGFVAMAK